MEQYIMPLKDAGLVEPEEERHQWVFHVAVSGRYADFRGSKMAKVEAPADDVSVPDSIPLPAANDLSVVDPQQ
jgi:hypothetical protein